MSWWPGWGSITGAEWWSNFYFWAGILCLFMLGASEVVSHRYALRKDELISDEQRETEKRHKEDMARAHIRAPRTINATQRRQIVAYLAAVNPKGDVFVMWKQFDEEAEGFARQVISVLNESGFQAKEASGPMGFGIPGAWIVVRDFERLKHEPSAAGAIQVAFREICGISFDGAQRKDPFPDIGETVIAIGAQP
jgi:hypothetical protein